MVSPTGTCYTHHQKTVILDAPVEDGSDKKRVIAFIGGLDVTDGRYDTPEFPLWKTINTLHVGDFYNNCVPGVTSETGPRQPWHDCHARVIGEKSMTKSSSLSNGFSYASESLPQQARVPLIL